MTKAIVTGSQGFIASYLIKYLEQTNFHVIQLCRENGDISDPSTWEALPPVDVVFHLAGATFIPSSWNQTHKFFHTNVVGTENAINYCLQHKATLVYANAYTYGRLQSLPISELHGPNPNNPYALSKNMAEQLCKFASKYRGLTVTSLRIFNVYGPNQHKRFLIPHVLYSIRNGSPIEIKDLRPKRDYVFVTDLVDAFIKAAKLTHGYQAVNIGYGKSYSVREIIDKMQFIAGTSLPVIDQSTPRLNEVYDVYADISLAKTVLDWVPLTNLEEGLEKIWRATSK